MSQTRKKTKNNVPSELPVLHENDFEDRFENLVDRLWTIQDRINELKEFEKQWEGVFEILRKKTGKECKIHILGSGAYRSFHWDKYHVLVSDCEFSISLRDPQPSIL